MRGEAGTARQEAGNGIWVVILPVPLRKGEQGNPGPNGRVESLAGNAKRQVRSVDLRMAGWKQPVVLGE
jgi:hypothetical protein